MKKRAFATLFILVLSCNCAVSYAEPAKTIPCQSNEILSKSRIDVSEELREIIKDMKLQLISAQAEIDKLQDTGFNYKKIASDKDIKIDALEKQNQQLKQNLADKEKQLVSKNSVLTSKEQEIALKIAELDQKTKELEAKKLLLEDKERQLQELATNSLQKENQVIALKDASISDMRSQIEGYKSKLTNMNSKLSMLENQLFEAKNEIAHLKDNNTSLASNRSADHDLLIGQINSYKLKLEEMNSKLASSQTELVQVKRQLSDLKNENNVLASNNLKSKPLENIKAAVSEKKPDSDIFLKVVQYMKDEKPTAALVYYNLGRVYQDNKEYLKAVSNYKQALVLNPEYNKAYMQLGLVYAETGEYDKSVQTFKEYLRLTNNPKEQEIIRQFISKLEKLA